MVLDIVLGILVKCCECFTDIGSWELEAEVRNVLEIFWIVLEFRLAWVIWEFIDDFDFWDLLKGFWLSVIDGDGEGSLEQAESCE